MNEQIKQIAERLRGLRDVLELTAEDIARDSDISAEEYRLAETGDYDISVSMLQKIARTYNRIKRITSLDRISACRTFRTYAVHYFFLVS